MLINTNMSDTKEKIIIEQPINHPLETILDIEEGSTLMPRVEYAPETITVDHYDEKDDEIDKQIQDIYNAAMSAFEIQMEEAELVEGKYKARNGEVAVQFLNTALSAARDKAGMKQHKDKVAVAQNKIKGGPSTGNQQLIVADRNELLKQIFKQLKK